MTTVAWELSRLVSQTRKWRLAQNPSGDIRAHRAAFGPLDAPHALYLCHRSGRDDNAAIFW